MENNPQSFLILDFQFFIRKVSSVAFFSIQEDFLTFIVDFYGNT